MKKFVLVLAGVLSSGAVEAKLSSDKIEKQADNLKAVISACKFDKNVLNEVKSKSVGSAITSGVATVASGGAAALSVTAAIKSKGVDVKNDKAKDNNQKVKNFRLGSTIASGVATGANLASVALSGSSVKQLAELMDRVSDCQSALNTVSISE